MKTLSFLKKHLIWGMALMIGAVAMSFNSSSKKADSVKETKSTTYYYNSNDTSANAFATVSHWNTANTEDCFQRGERPCSIEVPAGQSLNDMLAGKDNGEVLAIANGRKP
ncbi:MAG TPA: hypothetical protein DCW95_02425 [Chryseobacterium sp.]|nr:hypothetical protein [Chryseobacterium sp.]